LLINGEISSDHFFTVLQATVFASIQAGNAFSFAPDISQAHGAAEESIRLIDNVPEIDADSEEGVIMDECFGHVEFEEVHFRYPSRPGVSVLRGLSFEAKPGTYCALVGESGCGKSTTIQLIERFYDPQAGRILIDGIDVKDMNVRSMRKHIALVSQEPTLYDGTIGWNIALGAAGLGAGEAEDVDDDAIEKVTEQQMRKAARQANILRFIESMPDGFDTLVGNRGTALSGGQKQRIAIARALIRDPKILLLDEATSALDSESEQVVQEALDKASRGRTTIAIAHRLSTISRADRIFCLRSGKVVEQGDHTSLMANAGLYAQLVSLQELQNES
jgi:ATP-binding cassette subfamily B (MDR/TAP) protein 1